jgi:hypothetical protein
MPLVASQHWLGQPVLPIDPSRPRIKAAGPLQVGPAGTSGCHRRDGTGSKSVTNESNYASSALRLTRAVAAVGAVVAAVLVAAAIRAAFAATFVAAAAGRRGRRGRGEREHAGAQGKRRGQGEQRFGKHDETHFLVDDRYVRLSSLTVSDKRCPTNGVRQTLSDKRCQTIESAENTASESGWKA